MARRAAFEKQYKPVGFGDGHVPGTLGVERGATAEEIRDAYRTLAKVWHPDRFQGDIPLRRKAEEKLKEINTSFQLLNSTGYGKSQASNDAEGKPQSKSQQSSQSPSSPKSQGRSSGGKAASAPKARQDSSRANQSETAAPKGTRTTTAHSDAQQSPPPPQSPEIEKQQGRTHLGGVVGVVIAVVVLAFIKSRSGTDSKVPPTQPSDFERKLFVDPPKHSEQDSRESHPWADVKAQEGPQNKLTGDQPTVALRRKDGIRPQEVPQENSASDLPYFTVGSTKQDVIRVQGTPSAFSEGVFDYGLSKIYFRDGRVTTWEASPLNRLNVRLNPEHPVPASENSYTVGSTKDEVLAVQGTPTQFSRDVLDYGLSKVFLKDDRVVTWEISPLNPLRARLAPATGISSHGYFTVGSTKDEVLAVQGTPTQFSDSVFSYGLSEVFFQSGRVVSWSISPLNPLKAQMQ
jgi:outer membrane protein assembly factor BamE (lipoprotein component of BamABCDE complex)